MTKTNYGGYSYFQRIQEERKTKQVEYPEKEKELFVTRLLAYCMFTISLLCGVAVIADYTFQLNLFN